MQSFIYLCVLLPGGGDKLVLQRRFKRLGFQTAAEKKRRSSHKKSASSNHSAQESGTDID